MLCCLARFKILHFVGIVIGFLGDVMQQKMKAHHDTSLLSVEMHFWYKLLDRVFPTASLRHVAIKVCLDEAIMAPNFCLSMLAIVNVLEGSTWEKFVSRLKNSFLIMYLSDIAIYTPVQCINFYFLPTRYRTVFVYSASALYLCIASYNEQQHYPSIMKLNLRKLWQY
ncbi:Mpv17 PMP22 domain containing protein [Trichuris trichiura]|uniref:Mpv17 PMP22 domain containing protein n=1 Tax=Trichuris trichiura TaxID=36087 RepID=A0A077ZB94_TRITR|nr:Mpv17 PMP22 domain containing protein [Trichuris trichiura]